MDVAEIKRLSTIATLDASQMLAEQRKLIEGNKALAASEGQVQAASERTGQALNVSERALQAREIRLGGVSKASALLARAELDLAKTEQTISAAQAQGAASEARLNQMRVDAVRNVNEKRAALQAAVEAEKVAALQTMTHTAAQGRLGTVVGDTTGKIKLSGFQLQNLGYQINDVVTSLATGQRPLMVLGQQGTQITQIFGGVGGMFRYIGQTIAAIGAPILGSAAAVTAFAGAMLLGLRRAADLDAQLRALKTTLAATGGASGISAANLQTAALDFARQPGVSRDSAIQAAQGLASNPLLNADLLRRALPVVRDFAAATGKEIPDAAKAMATALTGGYSAAKQLDAQFQILSVAELNQIRNLEEQGRKGEAANIVLAAMQRQFKGLADGALTDAARATNSLGNAWDNMLDKLAKSGPIQRARQQLIDLLNAIANFDGSKISDPAVAIANPVAWLAKRLAESGVNQIGGLLTSSSTLLNRQITAGQAIAGLGDPGDLESATSLMDGFRRATTGAGEAVTTLESIIVNGGKGALHSLADQANDAVQQLDPASREVTRLANLITLLGDAYAVGAIKADDFSRSMALVTGALRNVQTPEAMLARLQEDVKIAAMSPAEQAAARERLRFKDAGADDATAKAAADAARRRYYAGQGSGLGEQIAGIRAGAGGSAGVIAAYAQSTEAGRRAEIELKALEAQYKNGAAAVRAYADALIAQDAAQRRIEGARDLAKLKDEVADTEKLNDALAQGTLQYERQKAAIEAATKVRQGYLTPAQGADYEAALLAGQSAGLRRDAIDMNRRADPQAQLADDMARLDALKKLGLSQQAYALAVRDANDAMHDQADRIAELQGGVEGLAAGFLSAMRASARASSEFRVGADLFDQSTRLMGDALIKLAQTGEFSFNKLLGDFSSMLIQMGLRAAASDIFGALGGLFKGSSSGSNGHSGGSTGGGGFFSGIFSAIGSLLGFAEGGRPPVGQPSIVGERGWEVFVPDVAGTVYTQREIASMAANGSSANGAGGVTIVQHNVFGDGVNGMTRAQIGAMLVQAKDAAVAEVYDRIRRGGSYAAPFRAAR